MYMSTDTSRAEPPSPIVDLDEVERRLREVDMPSGVLVQREPSAVSGSPFDYLYVYLTPDLCEGEHLIVSDAREWEDEDGYMVGRHAHYERSDPNYDETKVVTTTEAAVSYVMKEVFA